MRISFGTLAPASLFACLMLTAACSSAPSSEEAGSSESAWNFRPGLGGPIGGGTVVIEVRRFEKDQTNCKLGRYTFPAAKFSMTGETPGCYPITESDGTWVGTQLLPVEAPDFCDYAWQPNFEGAIPTFETVRYAAKIATAEKDGIVRNVLAFTPICEFGAEVFTDPSRGAQPYDQGGTSPLVPTCPSCGTTTATGIAIRLQPTLVSRTDLKVKQNAADSSVTPVPTGSTTARFVPFTLPVRYPPNMLVDVGVPR